ncbi:uncharacterized protein LOC127002275 [Eriocheir sinensis]|uniref:uncharacterized protein LOC127002233 n=1 Tax=Eriocheir sinensis TaxID=95602 RepID=UPI0021CA32E5|nr:uncharacterized protein LOC127002233 [Eriocheir sinensis]XP_050724044.1 uncharacterized protein LOC127002275 [Eriocheir sinensis]
MTDWKKSFIEAEQEKTEGGGGAGGGGSGDGGVRRSEPMKRRVGLYVTVCLFVCGVLLMLVTLFGGVVLNVGWMLVVAGGCVGIEVVVAGGVVTCLGRGLPNTALAQGYLVLGLLSAVSLVLQIILLALLVTLGHHTPDSHTRAGIEAWVQFVGGAQGAMAVLVGGVLAGTILVTSCCCKSPKDNVVGVYHPR